MTNPIPDIGHYRYGNSWPMATFRLFRFVIGVAVFVMAWGFGAVSLAGDQTDAAPKRLPDKVFLKNKSGSGELAASGVVLEYTGELLKLGSLYSESIRSIPSTRVIRVETPQTPTQLSGADFFNNREYQKAKSLFRDALRLERREWVQREILASLLRCDLAVGNYAAAGQWFQSIVESDPTTFHYYLIPLNWGNQKSSVAMVTEARKWLKHSEASIRLLGASWLLFDSQSQQEVRTELRRLIRNPRPRIHALAEALGWRVRIAEEKIENTDLDLWKKRLKKVPDGLLGGPYFVLGEAQWKQRQNEQAAISFLWIPMMYDHDQYLAARACWNAAQALQQIGQNGESRLLAAEVVSRFPQTDVSHAARQFLKSNENKKTKLESDVQESPEQ